MSTRASNLAVNLTEESRLRVVRQNRFDLVGEACFIEIENKQFEITDCSSFGIAFKSDSKFSKDQKFSDCKVFFNSIHICDVSIRVIRSDVEDKHLKNACEVVGQPIEMEKISGIKLASELTTSHKSDVDKFLLVPADFRRLVCDMKVWLLSLKDRVDILEGKMDFNRVSDKTGFENTVANVIGDYIVKTFEPQYLYLDSCLKSSDSNVRELAFDFFRSQMVDLLLNAPFHQRAFTKPLGYAGDYQMMNQIYANEGMGKSLFSKCLHLYFISAPESRAVRNRAEYLFDIVVNSYKKHSKGFRLLSVASGPAFEIQSFILKHPDLAVNTKFSLLDQDIEALQHAQKKIKVLERDLNIKLDVNFIHKPIKQVIAKGLDGEFDLIYSAGLFDYFTDPVAHMAARRLYDCLGNKGKLIIGNFSNSSLGQITMDIALDWHLIYRSPEDLKSLFAEIGNSFNIESEKEGINLFCHIDK